MMTEPRPSEDPARELRQLVEAGRYREALEAHRRTGEAVARLPEVELLAATAATRLGDLVPAVTLAESALERFRARADADGRMRAMNLLGAIAFEHGRLEDAERCFGEALEQARLLDDTRMAAHASNNLASVAHLRNRPDLALSLYRSALLAYQRIGDRRGTAQTYHNLGLAFRQRRDWGDAEAAALNAVRHAEAVGDGTLIGLAVTGRAEIQLEQDQLDLAGRELDRADTLARTAGDELGLAEAGRIRAQLALRQGDNHRAARQALEAREIAARLGSLQLQAECAGVAALALRRAGDLPGSAAHEAEALRIFERLGAEKLREDLRGLLST